MTKKKIPQPQRGNWRERFVTHHNRDVKRRTRDRLLPTNRHDMVGLHIKLARELFQALLRLFLQRDEKYLKLVPKNLGYGK